MQTFYKTFDQIKDQKFDGMIITGAPIEHIEFEEVNYWDELTSIMSWSRKNVYSTLHICWGAQAGLYYHYGIPKHPLPEKLFGVFRHTVPVSYTHLDVYKRQTSNRCVASSISVGVSAVYSSCKIGPARMKNPIEAGNPLAPVLSLIHI